MKKNDANVIILEKEAPQPEAKSPAEIKSPAETKSPLLTTAATEIRSPARLSIMPTAKLTNNEDSVNPDDSSSQPTEYIFSFCLSLDE